LQKVLHVERDEELVLNDQDAERSGVEMGVAVLLIRVIATVRWSGSEPELRGDVGLMGDHVAA
jgi:hypothetical protein